jgi:hypothetical protein
MLADEYILIFISLSAFVAIFIFSLPAGRQVFQSATAPGWTL